MKICDGETIVRKKEFYKDLDFGDIFTRTICSDEHPRYRTLSGHINLTEHRHYKGKTFMNDEVTFFPHACLTLGDPE